MSPALRWPRAPRTTPLWCALQRDLRALGYLRQGIDGDFGSATTRAVRALQYDLLNNTGSSNGSDGRSAVAMTSFNDDGHGGRRVTAVTGTLDEALAECLEAMLADDRVALLPSAADPAAENRAALLAIAGAVSTTAPTPYIAAMVQLESDGRHFHAPRQGDADTFVTVGLDRNDDGAPDRITSRGYGIGQYTLFHHPPRPEEVVEFISDPVRNVQHAYRELRDKFDKFVAGPHDGADDRKAEHPLLPLRLCKYAPTDQRYMRDCQACAAAARKVNIVRGTPCYPGAAISYQPTQYHPSATYSGVPDRADFPCDWPYAARRYNGSGVNSFHYQTRVLLQLLTPLPTIGA
jgi:peptidoglycan hydrolase-like protein with peptidoglycan-binding domain